MSMKYIGDETSVYVLMVRIYIPVYTLYTLYTGYEDLQREGVVVEHDEGYACLFFFKKD